MAKVGSVGCVGFLVEGPSACVLVDEAGSCLSGGHVHIWWCVLVCLWPYYDFMHPSANGRGCVPDLLVVWHWVSSTVSCWLLSEAGSWC